MEEETGHVLLEIVKICVDDTRVFACRFHINSGGGSISIDLFELPGDRNNALVASEAATGDVDGRCRSAKSVIGVDNLSGPLNFSANPEVSRAPVDQGPAVDQ